ncbi:hypothetical protein LEMA_P048330.1 [Plenodomus lingam JN3]|uniref:DUF7918 domain-containing protein n=1 Tax=Leptosphaeria maculans (strain JN3 / isolate v23.1.3 / race Av1-4-5-6-7-8) TaxID=985895 RepID=E5R5F7_LEPMJ|nr:hypothetical protein LEMA_P048330.1 [Plenodomus lingam JN3]CBX92127.1 hypothetical protein LEMA_P048330.1 [Plenodomus lingam JN3]
MAILEGCPGLEVCIVVKGESLREYPEDETSSPTVKTTYIEAQTGAEFSMCSKFTTPFPSSYGVEISTTVDGYTSARTYGAHELFRREGFTKFSVGFHEDGMWFRRNHCFTRLNIEEEVEGPISLPKLREQLQKKGCITLNFRWIRNICAIELPFQDRRGCQLALSNIGAVPEKVLKGEALSHQATLSPRYRTRPPKNPQKYEVLNNEPFATFHFKYRSLYETPASVDSKDRDEDNMTFEVLSRALRSMREEEAENVALKNENQTIRHIKRERLIEDEDDEVLVTGTRSLKRPREESEVIVLD